MGGGAYLLQECFFMLNEEKELIFTLDDERHIRELLEYNLENEGFRVKSFETAEAFFKELKTEIPDLILLDIMLNDANGMDICKKLRTTNFPKHMSIIMLTAKNEEMDRILGLEIGADDYITKPFSIRELITRIKVQLRKNRTEVDQIKTELKIRDIEIFVDKYEVYVAGAQVDVTPKEFDLLLLLARNSGKVLTREYIISQVWGYEFIGETSRTIDVHIRKLRRLIGDDGENYIETIRGIGYKMRDEKDPLPAEKKTGKLKKKLKKNRKQQLDEVEIIDIEENFDLEPVIEEPKIEEPPKANETPAPKPEKENKIEAETPVEIKKPEAPAEKNEPKGWRGWLIKMLTKE